MTGLLDAAERGFARALVIVATTGAVVWVLDRLFGGRR